MTEPALLVAVALMALLVGAIIPVLYQAYRILKRTRILLDTVGPRLEKTLDQVSEALDHVNQVGSTLESRAETIGRILGGVARITFALGSYRTWIKAAGAIAPAVLVGARALFLRSRSRRGATRQSRVMGIVRKFPLFTRVP